MATPALERAAKSKDPKKLLRELLITWRELKHPRVADLIDRVSAKSLEGVKLIAASSVPARAEAIVEAVKSKDPVELGRALVSQWPREWQAATPVLEAVCQAPEDPRVAKRLAELIDEAASQSRGTSGFWCIAFDRLSALGDVRQLPILEAQLGRSKSRYYREHSADREVAIVDHYRTLKIAPLSREDDALLAELEAPFAATAGVEKTKKRSGKELLEAVWANPTDLGVRAVYGDWLVEQGDPRGELIALQLAAPSEKSTKKIRSLIDKHWKKWLGPLADWFTGAPLFEVGFPARGMVADRDDRKRLDELLARPEWSTFRQLSMPWDLIAPGELVRHPRFKALTSLTNLEPEHIDELAKARPALTTLGFSYAQKGDVLAEKTWDWFEQLTTITLSPFELAAVLSGFEGAQRFLGTLQLNVGGGREGQPFDDSWRKLERAPIEVIELDCYGTRARVTRVKPRGPFTHVHVHVLASQRLAQLLEWLPPGTTHLTFEPGVARLEVPASTLEKIEKCLARYTKLVSRELPLGEAGPQVHFAVSGAAFPDEAVPKLWELMRDHFGVTFGNVQIGWSGSPTPLGEAPGEVLFKTARRRRTSWLYLAGASDRDARVGITRDSVSGTLPVKVPESSFDAFVALVESFGGDELSLGEETFDMVKFDASKLKSRRAQIIKLLSSVEGEE